MKRKMRKWVLLLCLLPLGLLAEPVKLTPQQQYILRWAPTAVREMYRSGVPASITLAQGLLESRYGLSPLAAGGNNHFGIKCHNTWTGKKQYHDDDAKGECFRVYESAEESFRDHSDFLRYRDRYKFLFEFETTDYKAWANGLKKAGYATDPAYPSKLIKYIEDYRLDAYDRMSVAEADAAVAAAWEQSGGTAPVFARPAETSDGSSVTEPDAAPVPEGGVEVKEGKKNDRKAERRHGKAARKAEKAARKAARSEHKSSEPPAPAEEDEDLSVIPESPLQLEEPKAVDRSQYEEFRFSLSRPMFERNGVPYVQAIEGETYASIAASNGLFLTELLHFNDLTVTEELLPGTIVYLQAKKNRTRKGLDKYIVERDGESLRDICQRFAVKMKAVEKMNRLPSGTTLREGDELLLREESSRMGRLLKK